MASWTSVKYLSPSSAVEALPSGLPVGEPSRSASGFSWLGVARFRLLTPASASRINSGRDGALGGAGAGLRAGAVFAAEAGASGRDVAGAEETAGGGGDSRRGRRLGSRGLPSAT